MMRDVFFKDFAAQPKRLLAAAGVATVLSLGTAFAQAQPAAAPENTAPVVQPVAQTAPGAQPAPGQPTVTPPASATGPAGEEPAPPPPALGPDGAPVAPPTDPAAAPPADGAAPAAAAPAEEGKKDGAVHDLSPWGMFMMATVVVKVVMVALVLASVLTWALLISKWLSMASLNGSTNRVLRDFRDSKSLQDAAGKLSRSAAATPAGRMLLAAADELRASGGNVSTGEKRDHLTSRISARMSIAQAESNQDIGSGMQIFATTGSISPFVGLFGTVYGIMNSFIGIAQSQTTNLAVVAPGIAEALFATAIGLFAAIPAVIFYNYFARAITAYNTRLDNFSGEVLVRLSRQLDAGA
jgi:biopolymer transport protein ExbB